MPSQTALANNVIGILSGTKLTCATTEELLKSRQAQRAFNVLLSLPESQNGTLASLNDVENAVRHERGKPDSDSNPWERGDFQRETDRKAKGLRAQAMEILGFQSEDEILKNGVDFREGAESEFWPEVEAFCSTHSKTGFSLRKALEISETSMSQSDFENLFSLCPVASVFEAFLRNHSAFSRIAFQWPISAHQILKTFGADAFSSSKGSLWGFEKVIRQKVVAASELRPDLLKTFLESSSNLALYARVFHGFHTKSTRNGNDESQSVFEEDWCALLVLEAVFNQYCLSDGQEVVTFKKEEEMLRHLEAENLMPNFLEKKKFRVLAGEEGKDRIIEKDGTAYFVGYGRSSKDWKSIRGVSGVSEAYAVSPEFFSARTKNEQGTTDVLITRSEGGSSVMNIVETLGRPIGKAVDEYFIHLLFNKESGWKACVSKINETGLPTELVATCYGTQASFAWSVINIEYDGTWLMESISKWVPGSDYDSYRRFCAENDLS